MRIYQNQSIRIGRVDKRRKSNNPYEIKSNKEHVHWSSKSVGFQPIEFVPARFKLMKSTGQRPNVTESSKGVARLGIREGAMVGIKITLRGRNKYRYLKWN